MWRKWFKIIGLGLGIWSLSLLWPGINDLLPEPFMLISLLGLAIIVFLYLFNRSAEDHRSPHHSQRTGETPQKRYPPPKLIQKNLHL